MMNLIRHAVRLLKARKHEREKRERRSPHWPKVEKAHLAAHPSCAACGSTTRLQVHHEVPFHRRPELELDPKNLITLCMSKNECHILIGHGDSFEYFNPNVAADAAEIADHPERRPMIVARAKAKRLPNQP